MYLSRAEKHIQDIDGQPQAIPYAETLAALRIASAAILALCLESPLGTACRRAAPLLVAPPHGVQRVFASAVWLQLG